MRLLLVAIIVIPGLCSLPVRAQPIPAVCQSKALEKELSTLESQFFSDKLDLRALSTYTNKLGELNNTYPQIANPACRKEDDQRLRDKSGKSDTPSLRFRKFHFKLMETTTANNFLRGCAKDKDLLTGKVDRIIRKIASTRDLNVCSEQKNAALAELDLFSKALDNQEKIGRGTAVDGILLPSGSVADIEQQLYYQSPAAHSDNLSFASVHANNPELVRMHSQETARIRKEEAIKIKLSTNEGALAAEAAIRAKFGFDIYGQNISVGDQLHKKMPEGKERAKRLHLALMDGNRINCLSNYLYFTSRFTFAPEAPQSVGDTVTRLFGKDFGKEPKSQTVPGSSHNPAELTKLGEETLSNFKKIYKDAPTLDEDAVITMLGPTIELMAEAGRNEAASKMGGPMYQTREEFQQNQERKFFASQMSAKKRAEALEASAKSEVGFLYGTKALEKMRFIDGMKTVDKDTKLSRYLNDAEKHEERRKIVRAALKERLEQSEAYAKKVRENQSANGKSLSDLAEDGEMMIYASPVVISNVVQKEPKLLASMCDPMSKAASTLKGKQSELAQTFKYAGMGMSITGNPIGIVAGTTFGLIGTGISAYDKARQAAVQERLAKAAGKGEFILDAEVRTDAEKDKTALDAMAKKNRDAAWEEMSDGIQDVVKSAVGGRMMKIIGGEILAAYKARKLAKLTAQEMESARNYFNFEKRIAALPDGPEKTGLLLKKEGWDEFIKAMETKLGRSLNPDEVDEFMVLGWRAHKSGTTTIEEGIKVADRAKKEGLVPLRDKVAEKLQNETGVSRKIAKNEATSVVKEGSRPDRLTFGDAQKKFETLEDAKTFQIEEWPVIKNRMTASGKSELEFFKDELDHFSDQYVSAMKMAAKKGESTVFLQKHLNQQLEKYRNWLSQRINPHSPTKGEPEVDALLAKKGILRPRDKYVYTAPPEPPPLIVVSQAGKSFDEGVDLVKQYWPKYRASTLDDQIKPMLRPDVYNTQVRTSVQSKVAELKKALNEVQDVQAAYGGRFEESTKINANYIRKSLEHNIEELNKLDKSIADVIGSHSRNITAIKNGEQEITKYVIDRSLEKFAQTQKVDAGLVSDIKDQIKSIQRARTNFTNGEIPGLQDKEVDAHLKMLEGYLQKVGAQ